MNALISCIRIVLCLSSSCSRVDVALKFLRLKIASAKDLPPNDDDIARNSRICKWQLSWSLFLSATWRSRASSAPPCAYRKLAWCSTGRLITPQSAKVPLITCHHRNWFKVVVIRGRHSTRWSSPTWLPSIRDRRIEGSSERSGLVVNDAGYKEWFKRAKILFATRVWFVE